MIWWQKAVVLRDQQFVFMTAWVSLQRLPIAPFYLLIGCYILHSRTIYIALQNGRGSVQKSSWASKGQF
jgi:hypothetical protein